MLTVCKFTREELAEVLFAEACRQHKLSRTEYQRQELKVDNNDCQIEIIKRRPLGGMPHDHPQSPSSNDVKPG